MTDVELVLKRLAFIKTCVEQLHLHSRPDRIESDIVQLRFAEHTLQLAIQAMLDCASQIVSAEHYGEPSSNRELFELLARNGWIEAAEARTLKSMVSFRNIVVHGYLVVEPKIVRQIVESKLPDLLRFVEVVRARIEKD